MQNEKRATALVMFNAQQSIFNFQPGNVNPDISKSDQRSSHQRSAINPEIPQPRNQHSPSVFLRAAVALWFKMPNSQQAAPTEPKNRWRIDEL